MPAWGTPNPGGDPDVRVWSDTQDPQPPDPPRELRVRPRHVFVVAVTLALVVALVGVGVHHDSDTEAAAPTPVAQTAPATSPDVPSPSPEPTVQVGAYCIAGGGCYAGNPVSQPDWCPPPERLSDIYSDVEAKQLIQEFGVPVLACVTDYRAPVASSTGGTS
jgi:hypothetical protein